MLPSAIRFLIGAIVCSVCSAWSGPSAQIQAPWWERAESGKVGHYWIKTDLPTAQANALAHHLNVMYDSYARRMASLPQRVPEKLNVLIFARQQDYLDVLRSRYSIHAHGTGGMFFVNQRGAGLAFWTEGLPLRRIHHVLQHEGFHQFAYSRFGTDLPPWLNEGLAEFFGESVRVGRELVIGQSKPRVLDTVKEAVDLDQHIPFAQMLSMTSVQWSAAVQNGSAALQYQQAWSMVHFLVYGDGGKYVEPFESYLRSLNQGVPSAEAFARAFGPEIEAFENRWKAYVKAAKPSAFVTALERVEFLAEGAMSLSRMEIVPATLDQLRAQLVATNFTHSLDRHGLDITLDAKDPALYQIPIDALCKEQPVLVVEPINVNRLPRREQFLEERRPSPPVIKTLHLRPRNLEVRWERVENEVDGESFRYQILLRK